MIRTSDRMQAESCTLLGTVVLLICLKHGCINMLQLHIGIKPQLIHGECNSVDQRGLVIQPI